MIVTLATEHRTRLTGWLTPNYKKTAAKLRFFCFLLAICRKKPAQGGQRESGAEQPDLATRSSQVLHSELGTWAEFRVNNTLELTGSAVIGLNIHH